MHGETPCDVVLISHGHLLRGFIKRWLRYPLAMPLSLMLEPGGIGILRQVSVNIGDVGNLTDTPIVINTTTFKNRR